MIEFDELWPGGPRLARTDESFRLSTDSVLLAHFTPAKTRPRHIVDLGAGAGVLGVLLSEKYPGSHTTALELQPESARLCHLNFQENKSRGQVVCADLRQHRTLLPAGYADMVVSNPPYFPAGGGASAPDESRRIAREEICCTLEDLCTAAAWLCRWGGSFCMVHRPERLSEICCTAAPMGLEPKRLRMVHYKYMSAPSLILLELRRGAKPGLQVEPPLILTGEDGAETDEVKQMYHRENKK